MELFSRPSRTIEPVPTHLNVAWFRTWADDVIRDSGVDPNNEANGVALLLHAGRSTWMLGDQLRDQWGGALAKPILREYVESDQQRLGAPAKS